MDNANLQLQLQQQDRDKLITLVADVKNLSNSQTQFHKEMKDSFQDLKDNFAGRLDDLDKRTQNLEITRTDFREKLNNQVGYQRWIMALVVLLVGIMLWHIIGYHL